MSIYINRKKVTFLAFSFLFSVLVFSCSKQDTTYEHFIRDGEIRYSVPPDSIRIFSGQNRIKLSWLLISTPTITHCRVYWNDGMDSVNIPIKATTGDVDTVNVIIDNLKEGTHGFSIYTYDKEGNSSIAVDTFGIVYGDEYAGSIHNRVISEAEWKFDTAYISFGDHVDGLIGTKVKYFDEDGTSHEKYVDSSIGKLLLPNYDFDKKFTIQSLYAPNESIDTFLSVIDTMGVSMKTKELDKTKFSRYKLPGDLTNRYTFSHLWDNKLGHDGVNSATHQGFPQRFQIDLGVEAKLTKVKTTQMWNGGKAYASHNIRHYQVWGSNNPAQDGSYDGWTLLADCKVVKPTGMTSSELAQAAKAGDNFDISLIKPAVRYVRFKILSTFDMVSQSNAFLVEVAFWGQTR